MSRHELRINELEEKRRTLNGVLNSLHSERDRRLFQSTTKELRSAEKELDRLKTLRVL